MTGPPLRVAFCIDNMNPGGTELNALRTAPHLLAAGVELNVFCLSERGPLLERYTALGVRVDTLPLRSLYGRGALTAGREMRRIIKHRGVEIVHAHDFYSNIFAGPWARSAGARFIASRRWWEGPERRLQRWANRASYFLASRVLANSPAVAEMLASEEHLRRHKIVVVQNFLDDAAFTAPVESWTAAALSSLGVPTDALVVGVVANLSPIKNHAMLLRAAAQLIPQWPNLHLVLVGGDGGSWQDLQDLAAAQGLADRVHFAGRQPSLPSWHHAFHISVLTSVSEGMPNSVLEAMAATKPVVATAVGGVPDAILEGTTGYLVSSGDVDTLADRLSVLLANPVLRKQFGQAGQARARHEYSVAVAIDRLIAVYETVCGRRGDHVGR